MSGSGNSCHSEVLHRLPIFCIFMPHVAQCHIHPLGSISYVHHLQVFVTRLLLGCRLSSAGPHAPFLTHALDEAGGQVCLAILTLDGPQGETQHGLFLIPVPKQAVLHPPPSPTAPCPPSFFWLLGCCGVTTPLPARVAPPCLLRPTGSLRLLSKVKFARS